MNRIFGYFVMALLIASIVTNAQPRRTPEERAKLLKDQLNLTDEQTAKVDSLYTLADTKFQEASQNGFDRTKFRSIMDSTNTEIDKLLTDEQKDSFKKIIEERRNRMRGNRQNRDSN